MNHVIVGGVEEVSLPAFNIRDLLAKVDTGAWSGALHATNIRERDGVLSFWPLGDKNLRYQTKQYDATLVRSANGHLAKRYLIATTILVCGSEYHIVIGLSDRTTMSRKMLLGRRFLISNNIVVDVSRTRHLDHETESTT